MIKGKQVVAADETRRGVLVPGQQRVGGEKTFAVDDDTKPIISLESNVGGVNIFASNVSPEGRVTADAGKAICFVNGVMWRKATGAGNTGWIDTSAVGTLSAADDNTGDRLYSEAGGGARTIAMPAAEVGKSYSISQKEDGTWTWTESYNPPPLDTFVDGWSEFSWLQMEAIMDSGTMHGALGFSNNDPVINGHTFEGANVPTNTAMSSAGYVGTNWELTRGGAAWRVGSASSSTGRGRASWPDGPDPFFGQRTEYNDLCVRSMRRHFLMRFNNLTPGNRYYIVVGTWGYCGISAFSFLKPYLPDQTPVGDALGFGADGPGLMFSKGIKRFGFEATDTELVISKFNIDTNGAYIACAFCVDLGPAP